MGIDPVTLAIGSMVLTGGSALAGAAGARQEAAAIRAQTNYQAQVAENNKKVALDNARLAEAEGAAEEAQQALRNKATMGAIKAGQAASGVDIGSGSPVDVRTSAAELGSLDVRNIRADAARTAYGFERQAAGFQADADLQRMAGSAAKKAGNLEAFSSIIGGASSIGRQYSSAKKQGIF